MNAEQLKKWRAQHNLTQEVAAQKIGCSKRSIQLWESGTNRIPDYIAMAVSAVSMNLPPYGAKSR